MRTAARRRSPSRRRAAKGDADVCGVRFRYPLTAGAICPCAWDAAIRDSGRASMRGRLERGESCDCAGRAFSRRDRGYAFCQTDVRQLHGKCFRPRARRARGWWRLIARVSVWTARERPVPACAHASLATAVGLHKRVHRNRHQTATPPHSGRRSLAALSARHDAPLRRHEGWRAIHRRRAVPARLQDLAVAEVCHR